MKKISLTQKQFDRLVKVYQKGGFLIVLSILLTLSWYFNKLYQAILILLAFFLTQNFYKQQFHATSMRVCLSCSLGIFSLLIYLSPPNGLSIAVPAIFGCVVSYISSKVGVIQYKLEDYADIEPKYNELLKLYQEGRIVPRKFELTTCTKDELIYRCKELNFTQRNIDFCIDIFYNKLSIKDYINLDKNKDLHLDEQQERNRKTRLKKLLEGTAEK